MNREEHVDRVAVPGIAVDEHGDSGARGDVAGVVDHISQPDRSAVGKSIQEG